MKYKKNEKKQIYYVICTAVIILSAADKQMLQRKDHRVIKSEKIII